MKKLFTLLVAVFMAFVATFSVGCGGGGEDIDSDKTQLYIGITQGGLGTEWMQQLKIEYETLHPDVQIMYDTQNDPYKGNTLQAQMKNNKQDLYFVYSSDYESFVNADVVMDITELVTTDYYDNEGNLVETGATMSIEDRIIDEQFKDYFNVDGKYFGLPFYNIPSGIIYDADLFEQKCWYFNNAGSIGAKSNTTDIGNGPDGVPKTYDDGLPATYEQFKTLLARINKTNVPFMFSAQTLYQRNYVLAQIAANYEGKNNYGLNFTFNGTDSNLGAITKETGYKLVAQQGKKQAIEFAYDIVKNGYVPKKCLNNAIDYKGAQQEFIQSISFGGNNRIAMLFEGSFWERESAEIFDEMAINNPNLGFGKRNFKLMPLPRFEGSTNERQVMSLSTDTSLICISKTASQPQLAKDFLKFALSRANMARFTELTGTFYAFNYKIESDEIAKCTPFIKSCIEQYNNANVDKVYTLDVASFIKNSKYDSWMFKAQKDVDPFTSANKTLYPTANDYWNSHLETFNASNWLSA